MEMRVPPCFESSGAYWQKGYVYLIGLVLRGVLGKGRVCDWNNFTYSLHLYMMCGCVHHWHTCEDKIGGYPHGG